MTIKYDRFAFSPKICDRCRRKFIFEGYKLIWVEVGIEHRSIQVPLCKNCLKEKSHD